MIEPELNDYATVYIAGPMTNLPDFNRAAFESAATRLRKGGWRVVSPVELDDDSDFDPGAYPENEIPDALYRRFLLRDLTAILERNVEAIVVLDGWEKSNGASVEVKLARALGIPIFDTDYERVLEPSLARHPTEENILEEASRIVRGDRQDQYGHPIEDFTRTAAGINAFFGTAFEARDIPVIMILVKLSRVIQSPTKRDSFVDIAGYARTREMVAEREGAPLE